MYNKESLLNLIKANNCEVLDDLTVVKKRYSFKCFSGHFFTKDLSKCIYSNIWCTNCHMMNIKYTNLEDYAKKFNGKILEIGLSDLHKWECEKGHIFSRKYRKMLTRKNFCPICNKRSQRVDLTSICHELAKKQGGKFISNKYITSSEKYDWECKNGHIFSARYPNVRKGHWCPNCSLKTENRVREIFEEITKRPFPKSRPLWLKSPDTGKGLELDGFNEDLKLAFEYDGKYHYIPHFKNKNYSVEKRQAKDLYKTQKCIEMGVKLIRIPYYEKHNLKEFILKELKNVKF